MIPFLYLVRNSRNKFSSSRTFNVDKSSISPEPTLTTIVSMMTNLRI